jgi:hypothetical protein
MLLVAPMLLKMFMLFALLLLASMLSPLSMLLLAPMLLQLFFHLLAPLLLDFVVYPEHAVAGNYAVESVSTVLALLLY